MDKQMKKIMSFCTSVIPW